MRKRILQPIMPAVLALSLMSCAAPEQAGFVAVDLPAQLSETSGLLCIDDEFVSFNDSGGLAVLYRFNRAGQIQQQLELSVKNIDWEAITSDGRFLYLGDIGNNAGKRSSLLIHKVPLDWSVLSQPYRPETLEIRLPSGELKPHQHDLDFEALVVQQQSLWLISKSWASQSPQLYQIDVNAKQQMLGAALPLHSPGFLVTDASFDRQKSQWWLLGYTNPFKAIWAYLSNSGFEAQLANYDAKFQLLQVQTLPTQGQVEGVCIDRQQQLWISEEAGKQQPARLLKLGYAREGR